MQDDDDDDDDGGDDAKNDGGDDDDAADFNDRVDAEAEHHASTLATVLVRAGAGSRRRQAAGRWQQQAAGRQQQADTNPETNHNKSINSGAIFLRPKETVIWYYV